VAQPR